MSPAWDPALRMTLHAHCLESSVPVGLETTVQAPIVCLATQAAGQWGAAGGAAVEGREPREEMSWDHPACWAAITGHRGHCHCQVSVGAEGFKSSMEGSVGWWRGSAPSCAKTRTGKSAHLLESAKVDQLYPKYHFPLHVSFPQPTQLQVLISLMGWRQGMTFPEQKRALWLCDNSYKSYLSQTIAFLPADHRINLPQVWLFSTRP